MEEKRHHQQEEPLVASVHLGGLTHEICVCVLLRAELVSPAK